MIDLVILTLITLNTCSSYTTHRYDMFDNFANYRPVLPFMDNMFSFGSSNGRPGVQIFNYPNRYGSEVKTNGGAYNHGTLLNNQDFRRVDTRYTYPYQKTSGHEMWTATPATEPAYLVNRFKGNHPTENPNSNKQVSENHDSNKQLNKRTKHGSGNLTEISKQSFDVNSTSVISEHVITDNKRNNHSSDEDNFNSTKGIETNNKSDSLHLYLNKDQAVIVHNVNASVVSNSVKFNNMTQTTNQSEVKQTPDTVYQPKKTLNNTNTSITNNNDRQITNHTEKINSERSIIFNTKHGSKTTQDNEVTPKSPELDDRWIWSNGEENKEETTTLFILDDRAAFSGNGCPDGKIKVGNKCIAPD